MTRVSCQKIRGSIPGSPKWSDDSWRLCICKVTHPRPLPKGGESEQRAIHAGFYIPYFTYSTTTPFCFQGREEWTNGNPRRPLHYLLLIFNKQSLLFPREGRMNWKQFMRAFTLFTSHSQQTTPLVSKGGEDELKAIHASLHVLYFSFSTNNASCFQGRKERTEGNPCEPLRSLLLILNKQRPLVLKGGKSELRAIHADLHIIYFSFSTNNAFLFPGEGRVNRGHSTRALTSFTSHIQQANASCFQGRREWTNDNTRRPSHHLLLILNKQRPPVSKGGKSELTAIHADLHLIYFSFSTSNDLLFAREEKLLHGYWYGNMNGLAD